MMDLQLVNKELCEAKLFRTTRSFNTLTGKDIADMLFLNTLVTYILHQEDDSRDWAHKFAKNTVSFGGYTLFRTFATDMYMLAYQTKYPDNDHARMKDPITSKKFLDSCRFHDRKHIEFLRRIVADDVGSSYASTYFYRLEAQLKISDSRYKRWRRQAGMWKTLRQGEKSTMVAQITMELRRMGGGTGRGNEVLTSLEPMTRIKKYSAVAQQSNQPSTAQRVAGTAVGAVAGRYAASKLNKNKNAGTGIGAIAGYWASGRRKQQ